MTRNIIVTGWNHILTTFKTAQRKKKSTLYEKSLSWNLFFHVNWYWINSFEKKIRQMEASHDLVYVWLNKLDVDGQKKVKFAFCLTLHCHFYHFRSIREHVNLNFALESYWYQANWIIWFKHNRSKVMNVNAYSLFFFVVFLSLSVFHVICAE